MAFGQQAGPPATARQLAELLELVRKAGHSDFKDARGPLGLNQRQAGGRFTRDEADALIDSLSQTDVPSEAVEPAVNSEPPPGTSAPRAVATPKPGAANPIEQALRKVPSTMLAAELQRRGWIVVEA